MRQIVSRKLMPHFGVGVLLKISCMFSKHIFLRTPRHVDVDDKIIISNQIYFGKRGFKYFIGYKDNEKVWQWCILLPKMSGYTKNYIETKYMFFIIKDDELLQKWIKIWNKVKSGIKKGFDCVPVYPLLKPNFYVTVVREWKRWAPFQQVNGSVSDDILRYNQSLTERMRLCKLLVCNEKYQTIKIKSYEGKINTNFQMMECQNKVLSAFL